MLRRIVESCRADRPSADVVGTSVESCQTDGASSDVVGSSIEVSRADGASNDNYKLSNNDALCAM